MFSEMKFTPTKDDFIELSKSYDVVAVEAKFTADADTPLSAYYKISGNKPAFLFESVVGGEQVSRFSFVGCNPRKIISCKQLETKIIEIGRKTRIVTTPEDPLALIEEGLPVIVIAPKDKYFEKTLSNMQEVIARGGKILFITNNLKELINENIRFGLRVPILDDSLSPILLTIPLQLLAYHVALLKNCDIDKPRNLAKSVTVE